MKSWHHLNTHTSKIIEKITKKCNSLPEPKQLKSPPNPSTYYQTSKCYKAKMETPKNINKKKQIHIIHILVYPYNIIPINF